MTAIPSKLFVLEVGPARHCLEAFIRPRILPLGADHPRPGANHIVILPVSQDLSVLDEGLHLPDAAWGPARIGRGKVVFDASQEGARHRKAHAAAMHGFLERIGVPFSQAVYVTQDRGYAEAYDIQCRYAGVAAPMKVVVFDYWIRELARQHEREGAAEFDARLAGFRARPRRRRWRFLSLNRALRRTKVLFLLRLMEDGLWDQGAISLGGLDWLMQRRGFDAGQMADQLFDETAFDDLNVRLRPLLPKLTGLGPITFGVGKEHPKFGAVLDEPIAEFGQTWFSVVTETEMRAWPSRITEKPLKPLLNFHPLITLGNPGSLRLIRDYGFQTFGGLIDESYDEELDPRRRFEMVYLEIRRLCALDEAEVDRLEAGLEEVLIFNARHGLIDLPKLFRSRYDPALVADILSPAAS